MNFTRDNPSRLTIRQVEHGAVKIGDETVRENVLIFRDEVQRGIAIDDIETLGENQLDDLLQRLSDGAG